MSESKEVPTNADAAPRPSRCSPVLLQEVVAILRERGIEATPEQVEEWAELMVERFTQMRGKQSEPRQWLAGVIHKMPTPTMCLHLHFGDAK